MMMCYWEVFLALTTVLTLWLELQYPVWAVCSINHVTESYIKFEGFHGGEDLKYVVLGYNIMQCCR
jgi:hypothetical protein